LYSVDIWLRSASNWWLRSPNTSNTNNFWYVNSNGNTNNNNANNTYGVCFDFLLNLARQSSVLKAHFLCVIVKSVPLRKEDMTFLYLKYR